MATLSVGQTTRESFGHLEHNEMFAARIFRQAERVRTPLVLSAEILLSAFSYALAVFVVGEARGAISLQLSAFVFTAAHFGMPASQT
jgi:hypothetical protein